MVRPKEETITIDEAIETLDVHQEMLSLENMPDLRGAVRLGIEALKQLIKMRLDNKAPGAWPLPGETPTDN